MWGGGGLTEHIVMPTLLDALDDDDSGIHLIVARANKHMRPIHFREATHSSQCKIKLEKEFGRRR